MMIVFSAHRSVWGGFLRSAPVVTLNMAPIFPINSNLHVALLTGAGDHLVDLWPKECEGFCFAPRIMTGGPPRSDLAAMP